MALGRNIGDAFIEVHARTGPFRRELARDARRAANDASNQMEKNFDPDFGVVGNRLRKQMKGFGTLSGQDFTAAVQKVLKDRSGRIAQSFADALATGDFSKFTSQFGDMDVAVRRFNAAIDRLNRSGVLARGEYQAVNRAFRDYRKTLELAEIDASNMQRQQDNLSRSNQRLRSIQGDLNALSRDSARRAREEAAATESRSRARRAAADLEIEFGQSLRGVIEELKLTDSRFERLTRNVSRNSERIKGALRGALRVDQADVSAVRSIDEAVERMASTARQAAGSVDLLNRGLGRFKGGRNDFLNLIGSLDQFVRSGVLRALDRSLGVAAEGVTRLGQSIINVRGPVGELGALLVGAGDRIQRMGSSLDGLVVQLILSVVAFNAFVAIAGPLTALLSALSGGFVALTVTVGGALAGGLLALGPMLLSVAAGAGVVALAFADLDKKTKALFKPLGDMIGSLREVAQAELFNGIGSQVKALADVLGTTLTPVVRNTAQAIRGFFNDVLASLQSPEFTSQMVNLARVLPGVLRALLELIAGLSAGLTNLFIAAAPGAQLLLERMTGVVNEFSKWAAGAQGRQQIADFMARAVELLGSIWGLIKQVSATFGIFFREGNQLGQAMIDRLAKIVENFNRWLNTKAGRDELRGWFQDARTIIGQVGDVLREAGRLIDNLDSPQNRAALVAILNGFEFIVSVVADAIALVNRVTAAITGIRDGGVSLQQVTRWIDDIVSAFADMRQAARVVAQAIIDSFDIDLFGRGQDIINGLIRGVQAGGARLLEVARGLANRITSEFAKVLRIGSPSKVFAEFGVDIIDGLLIGLRRQEKAARKASDRVARGVIAGAQETLLNARASLRRTSQQVMEALAEGGRAPQVSARFQRLGANAIRALTDGLTQGRQQAAGEIRNIIGQIGTLTRNLMQGEDAKTRSIIQRQSDALRQWVRSQGRALDAVLREVDRATARLDAARERLRSLQDQFRQLRDQTRDSLRGELNLGATVEDGATTFEAVAANVAQLAARMRKFANLLKKLIKAGLPAALVQEVASLGTVEGIAVARALLSGSGAERQQLIADFASIQRVSSQIGTLLADQMFGAGIEAQKGLIKGLEANRDALIKAAKKIAKTITDEIKRELGIRSPSTVFQQIGVDIAAGLARGITGGTAAVNQALGALVNPDVVANLNTPLSGLGAQAAAGSPATAGASIAPGAIQIVTPYADPRLVAIEAMDALAARGR